ncbi:unnamed protein product [Cyclocybe aegerita]|uniref:HMG box domain-containing protein n=1 Tax=Cyclocybe aegerita TaxID=1973307 RepID=A0A8S0W2E4_CYCAE|nr:unnamed protein product [Cyclocybe aegerita]
MPNPSKFDLHREQLAASLTGLAESMRNCAQFAETFAKIVNDASYAPEVAEYLNAAHDESAKGKRKAAASPDDADGPKKRKRTQKVKDPNAPKRPASSYILFQNEVRKELKEQHPNISNMDLLAMISEQWKNMSDDQKRIYNEAMKTANALYSEEKKAYDNRTPAEIEAANAALEAARALKKAKSKRGPKPAAAAPAPAVQARPPPAPEEVEPSTEASEDDDSEEEENTTRKAPKQAEPDSDSSEEEEASPEPAPKKRRGTSAQPSAPKAKKSSKV